MNVLIYRLPRGKSIVKPPSSCTSCGERVRFYDNIPVVSWFILAGKCRFCKTKISFLYPLVELLTGFLVWYSYYRFDLSIQFILAVLLILTALTAGFSDFTTAMDRENFECGMIPTSLLVFGLLSGTAVSYLAYDNILFPVYGAAGGFLALFVPAYLYKIVRKVEGMGFGDIYLVAVFGAFLGLKSVFFLVFGSAVLGTIAGLGMIIFTGRKDLQLSMPFGPFISISAIIYLFFETRMDRLLYGI